ncbi:MAG: response regulator [Acidobacteriia bacterium]|nr:response regulator [Terriglobia bacterium]
MKRFLRLLAVATLMASAASAEHYRFRHYGPDEGLNTTVSGLLQDRTGFLWVGTGNGLFRYDGARFQRFGAEDGLPSASIRSLLETSDGTLWIVTGRGLARRHGSRFEPVAVGADASILDFRNLAATPDGKLYLGSDRGLLRGTPQPGGANPRFAPAPGAPVEPVQGVFAEANGAVWFGCGKRLCLLEQGRVRTLGESDGLPPERWAAMLRDREGGLWVRGPQHLYVLAAGARQFVARDRGLPQSSNTIMNMALDRQGRVLVTTDQGLARWMEGQWQLTGTAQGLESDTVTFVFEDREGSIWIGLWGAGVDRWPGPSEWTNWTTADGLTNNLVWAVRRHPSGALWVGTDRGLVRMAPGAAPRSWFKKDGLGGDKIKALAIAPDGAIWAGCLPGGVSRIDPVTGKIRNYGVASGLADDRVIALYLDGEDRLWASTAEGLFRSTSLAPGLRFERQAPPGISERAMFFRFHGDSRGRMWVTSVNGLFRWDHGKWTRFGTGDGLKANSTTHVIEDGDGAIWVAYREPIGLSRLTFAGGRLQVENLSKKDGLPSDYAIFFGLDSRRRLWVGTDTGVAVRSAGRWIVYTHEDGLGWDDCAANSFWPEPDGSVWIGTLKGLSRFRPAGQPLPAPAPPAVITSVRFGGHAADMAATSRVAFRDRDFQVSFSGLTFLREKHVLFRYRLAGLEEGWTETGSREARYSSLPSGHYRFEVAARNPNGAWSPSPATVAFHVVPPWWQTWWFRCFAAAGLTALLTLALRARTRQMRREHQRLESAVRERTGELELQKDVVEKQKREIEELLRQSREISRLKSEFLANMSHEIRTPMNGVIGMTQLALGTALDEEQREYISTVRDSAESLMVVINDILDFSKIEAGKLELTHEPFLLSRCVADALQVFAWKAQEKGLRLTHCVSPEIPDALVGDAGRLRQILLNLVGNAMKFTERGEIAVTVTSAGTDAGLPGHSTLCFAVRDTGMGIPRDKQDLVFEAFAQADGSTRRRQGGTGLGLAICSKLVRLMNGRIWLDSVPGAGSTFSFSVAFATAGGASGDSSPFREMPGPDQGVPKARPAQPLRILLAEDNAVNQKLAQRMIERMGHHVTVADNGRKAADGAAAQPFDLILMDLQMPEMDGFEATACIRSQERAAAASGGAAQHIPIVAMTAHAMSGDREQCLLAGMDDYISKPVSLQALAQMLDKVQPCSHAVESPVA